MRRGLLVVAGLLVGLLVASQFLLPAIAERKLRSDLREHGSGVRVEVDAFPAIKLLWGTADRVTATVRDYRSGGENSGDSLADMLARTDKTNELDVHVRVLHDRLLRMQDARLTKKNDALTGEVWLRRQDIDAALPARLRLISSSDTEGLSVAGVTSVFGQSLAARARILVDDGRLVLRPEGIPLASLVTIAIFSDERVLIDAISARATPDGYAVIARGRLRG